MKIVGLIKWHITVKCLAFGREINAQQIVQQTNFNKMQTVNSTNITPPDAKRMLAGVIGYDTSRQPIIPVRNKLVIKKNAHPNCDGTDWGWIEGCSLNICWSDENSRFNRKKAEELVRQYNAR